MDGWKKRTPDERAGLSHRLELQVPPNGPNGLDRSGAGRVPREHDVKVGEGALLEAIVDIADLVGRGLGSLDLPVGRMIAFWQMRKKEESVSFSISFFFRAK